MTTSKPQISVLVVAYNAAAYLQRALDSVGQQSLADWELVVIEDGSRDGTEEIVAAFASQLSQSISYFNNDSNRGVSYSRTRALRKAKGRHVAFLDADDWWSRDHLDHAVKTLNDGHGLCYSGVNVIDATSGATVRTVEPTPQQRRNPQLELFKSSFIQTSSCVALSRRCFEAVGEFDESLSIGEDRDYWLRCAEKGFALGYTGNASCHYYKHAGNTMSKTIKVAEQSIEFYRKRLDDDRYPRSLRRQKLFDAYRNHALVARKTDRTAALHSIKSAIRLRPFMGEAWVRLAQIGIPRRRQRHEK